MENSLSDISGNIKHNSYPGDIKSNHCPLDSSYLNNYNPNYSYLRNLLELSLYERRYHICIWDTSGIIRKSPALNLPSKYMLHYSEFCDAAKSTTKGLNHCLRCKRLTLYKASKSPMPFIGQCYMGITEIVKPVYVNNKLICVIYLGNFILKENMDAVKKRIKKSSRFVGINEATLISKLDTVDIINSEGLQKYINIVNVIYDSIIFACASKIKDAVNIDIIQPANIDFSPAKTSNHIIQSVIDYINVYYYLDLKLEQFANLYFLNPNYLRNLFKKCTGTNFTDYLNRFRIKKAIELLKNSDKKIIDICTQVGFNNVTYFNKLIKKYTGSSPKQHKKHQPVSTS